MIHWCADETAALMSFLSVIPFAFRWVRIKVKAVFTRKTPLDTRPPNGDLRVFVPIMAKADLDDICKHGCGECDEIFPCFAGKSVCIRTPLTNAPHVEK